MTEPKVELTVEQKKEAAKQAKVELAEKAKKEKAEKEEKAAADKLAANANKENELVGAVGTLFTTLTNSVVAGLALVATLHAESTVEEIAGVETGTVEHVKAGKLTLKEIKVQARKLKESTVLGEAVTASEAKLAELTNAVAPLKEKVTEAKKAAKEAEKLQKQKEREDAKAANAMPKQNDITRPRPDTACGKAWELMDRLSAKLNQPVPISLVMTAGEKEGLNSDTVKTQYARWKKYNGISGRIQMPVPAGLLD